MLATIQQTRGRAFVIPVGLLLVLCCSLCGGGVALAEDEEAEAVREQEIAQAKSVVEMGWAMVAAKQAEVATKIFDTAIAVFEKYEFAGGRPKEYFGALIGASMAHVATRRFGDALPYLEKALSASAELSGTNRDTWSAIGGGLLALVLANLGRAVEGAEQARAAVAAYERVVEDPNASQASVQQLRTIGGPIVYASLGMCLFQTGSVLEAIPALEAARAAQLEAKRVLPTQPGDEAMILATLGSAYAMTGRPERGVALARQAVEILGKDGPGQPRLETAVSRLALAECLFGLGQIKEAAGHAGAADSMLQSIDPAHEFRATSLTSLARINATLGRHAKAIGQCREAIAIARRRGDDSVTVLMPTLNLAVIMIQMGLLDEGVALANDVVERCRRAFSGANIWTMTALNNAALGHRERGELERAASLYAECAAMGEAVFGDSPGPLQITALMNRALVLHDLGRVEQARAAYARAGPMLDASVGDGDSALMVAYLTNRPLISGTHGKDDQGRADYERALAMAQRLASPMALNSATGLGFHHVLRKEYEPAREAYRIAINEAENARGVSGGADEDRLVYAAKLGATGVYVGMVIAEAALGNVERAFEAAERGRATGLRSVLERSQRLRGGDLIGLVEEAAQARGDAAVEAQARTARAVEDSTASRVARLLANIRSTRAGTASSEAERGQRIGALEAELAEAQAAHRDARRRVFELAGDVAAADVRPESAESIQGFLGENECLFSYVVSDLGVAVFVALPQEEGWGLGRAQWPDGSTVQADELEEAVKSYRRHLGGIDPTRNRGPLGRPPAAASVGAAEGYRLFEALISSSVWKAVRELDRVYIVPDGELNRLPFEALVVETPAHPDLPAEDVRYWLDEGPEIVYGPSATVLLNRKRARDAQLESRPAPDTRDKVVLLGSPVFHRHAREPAPMPDAGIVVISVEPGSSAERLGLDPGAIITAYGPHAISSAEDFDAALGKLLLDLRLGKMKGAPVLGVWREGVTFTKPLDPSTPLGAKIATLDARLKDDISARAALRADESVVRGGFASRYGALTPLPGTRREVLGIYETFVGTPYDEANPDEASNVYLLLGESATRTRLYEAAPGCRYLHLATHGLVDTDRALYSSLALTMPDAPSQHDFGFLTLMDLFENWWQRLGSTELVVLSACDTQQGQVQQSEGVYGLTWGFMYAGATAVVASLWPVDDASTDELMRDFYSRVRAGADDRDAKLRAFVAARKALRQRRPHPRHWAPFLYTGDPR